MKQIISIKEFIKYDTFRKVQKYMDYALAQNQLPKPDVQEGGWHGDYELYYGENLIKVLRILVRC